MRHQPARMLTTSVGRDRAHIERKIEEARHEAAHAVAAEYLGAHTIRLVLRPNFGSHCTWDIPWKRDRFLCALVLLAGSVADHIFNGVEGNLWADTDYRAALHYAGHRIDAAKDLAWCIVEGHKEQVEMVAEALLKRDLSGAEVRRLLRAREPDSCQVRRSGIPSRCVPKAR